MLICIVFIYSAAIMKYLGAKHSVPNHWYPKDIEKRAKIDEYLSWHSGNLRMGAGGYMFVKVILYDFIFTAGSVVHRSEITRYGT